MELGTSSYPRSGAAVIAAAARGFVTQCDEFITAPALSVHTCLKICRAPKTRILLSRFARRLRHRWLASIRRRRLCRGGNRAAIVVSIRPSGFFGIQGGTAFGSAAAMDSRKSRRSHYSQDITNLGGLSIGLFWSVAMALPRRTVPVVRS